MGTETYPLLGFAPDLPQDVKGAIVSSSAILPTDRGISGGVLATGLGSPLTFDDAANAAAVLSKIDGTQRVFAGASTKIYEIVSGVGTSRGTGSYHASSSQTWHFAQFGDVSLAVNKGDKLQFITTGSAFADAAVAAPKASIVVVVGEPNLQFVMLFDYDDGTNNYSDGVFWSAANDYTDWTPAIATQCGNVRLLDVGGKFTAACAFRDGVVAFKKNAMYLGQYVGGDAVWKWQRISNTVGCLGKNAVVEANDVLYFGDQYGLWMFDGSYPRPMPGAVQKWWAANNAGVGDVPRFTFNKAQHRVWVQYGQLTGGYPAYIVYNLRSQLWTQYGKIVTLPDSTAQIIIISPDYAVDLGAFRQFFTLGVTNPPAAVFQLGAHGSEFGMTTINGIRPRWLAGPSDTASEWTTCLVYYAQSLRNATSGLGSSKAANFRAPGVFDLAYQARYLSPEITVNAGGQWECSAMSVSSYFNPVGE